MIDNPPEWLQDWGRQVGAKLEDGLREGPSFIAFARENGSVYHTYTVMAPDPFVAPYHSFLLKRTPKAEPEGAPRLAQGRIPGLIAVGPLALQDVPVMLATRAPRRSAHALPSYGRCSPAFAGGPPWTSTRFVKRLFAWVRTHRQVRMLINNQGYKTNGRLRLNRFPRALAALKAELRAPLFDARP